MTGGKQSTRENRVVGQALSLETNIRAYMHYVK